VSDGKGPVTPKPNGTPTISTKNTPEFRSSLLAPSGLKRQMSCDSQESAKKDSADQDDGDSGSRRSKRLKKGELLQRIIVGRAAYTILIQRCRYGAHCGWVAHVSLPLSRAQDTPG
jgi:hypothetical protein